MTARPENTRTAGALALAYMQRRMETETHDSALAPAFEGLRAYVRWAAERDAAAAEWEVSASRLREKLRALLAERDAARAEVARLLVALEDVGNALDDTLDDSEQENLQLWVRRKISEGGAK